MRRWEVGGRVGLVIIMMQLQSNSFNLARVRGTEARRPK